MDALQLAAQRLETPPLDVFAALEYVPTPKQRAFHEATEFDVLYGGAAGGGKGGRCPDRAAPSYDEDVETRVLTPKGFKLIGDIKTGDAVCNPDGTTAKVIGVFDNGPKQFYRVTLADGSTVEADEDHLWAVSIAGTRKRRKEVAPVIPAGLRAEDEWNLRVQSRCRIVNTVVLRELVLRAADEKARGLRPHYVQLPLTNPVALTGAKGRWPVFSPYV
ncbi:Hint domain-containing protein, partial [Streptomyces triculaminicus]|uniref:Hint domain-containing protein n=1 Tax=Streptomyces triculaminicus TaxID=2816232 RepID=UPI003787C545